MLVSELRRELTDTRNERDYWRNLFMERFDTLGTAETQAEPARQENVKRSRMSFSELRSRLEAMAHKKAMESQANEHSTERN